MIACYVSGAGMFAGGTTHAFKTTVIRWLERSGVGYDTRYRYYRDRFPGLDEETLARRICDPIEYYDPAWPTYRDEQVRKGEREELALAHFVAEHDGQFRQAAAVAIYCLDEAGFGSGINVLRFLGAGKPVLGFYASDRDRRCINLTNALQLTLEYPELMSIDTYRSANDITAKLGAWLPRASGR